MSAAYKMVRKTRYMHPSCRAAVASGLLSYTEKEYKMLKIALGIVGAVAAIAFCSGMVWWGIIVFTHFTTTCG
jgi:hypothetical protein